MVDNRDEQVRLAAFDFLRREVELQGEYLSRASLEKGFEFQGARVPLMGPQGIFKPAILTDMPLSITTVPIVEGQPRPYDDGIGSNGFLSYRYRGTDPQHSNNVWLRRAYTRGVPLIYHHGVVPGKYLSVWPVYVMGDDPASLTFSIALEDRHTKIITGGATPVVAEAERRYATRLVAQRLHQKDFRLRVIEAYRAQCAICRLKHSELLDAAHILPDGHPEGKPIVPNGLSLCKLHHAAFDENILGIRPDLRVEIREDILREKDGPMLLHGLQGFAGAPVWIPKPEHLQPKTQFLAERYERFLKA